MNDLITLKYDANNNIREHILWMIEVISKLKSFGVEVSDPFVS